MRMPTFVILCTLLAHSIIHTSESTRSQDRSYLLSDRQDRQKLETSAFQLSLLTGSQITECRAALKDAPNYQEIGDLLNTSDRTHEEESQLYNFFNNWLITQSIDIAYETAQLNENQANLERTEKRTRQCYRCAFGCSTVTMMLTFIPMSYLNAHLEGSSSEG